MQEKDRVVTVGLAVAAGLTGLAVALVIYALARAAPGPPTPPPGLANLYGVITDATGAPIVGAHGTVYQDYDSQTEQYNFTTDSSGYYLIENMLVEVDVTQMVVYANGYQTYTNEDIPIVEGNNELNFNMGAL